jgi:hypothetical protein
MNLDLSKISPQILPSISSMGSVAGNLSAINPFPGVNTNPFQFPEGINESRNIFINSSPSLINQLNTLTELFANLKPILNDPLDFIKETFNNSLNFLNELNSFPPLVTHNSNYQALFNLTDLNSEAVTQLLRESISANNFNHLSNGIPQSLNLIWSGISEILKPIANLLENVIAKAESTSAGLASSGVQTNPNQNLTNLHGQNTQQAQTTAQQAEQANRYYYPNSSRRVPYRETKVAKQKNNNELPKEKQSFLKKLADKALEFLKSLLMKDKELSL